MLIAGNAWWGSLIRHKSVWCAESACICFIPAEAALWWATEEENCSNLKKECLETGTYISSVEQILFWETDCCLAINNLSIVYVTPLLLTIFRTNHEWYGRLLGLPATYGTVTADDVWRPLVSLIFWSIDSIDQKMRLTKGFQTSSAAAGRPRRLQYHMVRGESLKSG